MRQKCQIYVFSGTYQYLNIYKRISIMSSKHQKNNLGREKFKIKAEY